MPPLPEPLASVFVVAFGLVAGSFLNVCIHRLPVGQSVVRPRSRCPRCGASIAWYHNVPVLSWIALRGACHDCASRISWRYPFVEVLAALAVLLLWRRFGATGAFAIAAVFTLALIVLFFTDYDHQLLPDAVTLTGFGAGLAVAWANRNIQVNAILPGWIRTDMTAPVIDYQPMYQGILQRTPAGRFGEPEEVAGAAVFLASEDAKNITGQTVNVDGGIVMD